MALVSANELIKVLRVCVISSDLLNGMTERSSEGGKCVCC